jgi:hypothetical protein
MKTLCITGISEPDLIELNTRFCQAGMAAPLSIEKNGRQLDMAQWHDRFCSTFSLDQETPGPGKFAEQLAGELFFSNMETPLWGWADVRSTVLLNFWADFDPRMVFVLTCCPLDHYLARLMETRDAASLDLEELVTDWHQFHAHLLQFYHTHPDQCLLVDIHDSATQFNALVQACRDKWDLPLTDTLEPESDPYPFPAPLARHIAASFTKNHPEAASLWHEILATVSSLTPDPTPPDDISFSHVAQSFQTIKDKSAELRQISDLEEQLESKSGQVSALEEKAATLQKELEGKDTGLQELEKKTQEATEENELILLQLHQVQEELEAMLLKKQEAEQQWAEKQQKSQTDLQNKEQQLKQREEQIATLQKQAQDTAAQLAQEKTNAAQKDSSLQQFKQQLDQKGTQLQEREKQIAALQKQLKDGTEKLTQQQQAAAKKDRDLDQLKKELAQKDTHYKELEQKNQEINEENELILLQLHQVQEELERYFLQHQQSQDELKQSRDELKQAQENQKQTHKDLEQTQEALKQTEDRFHDELGRIQQEKQQLEQRWHRLEQRIPDYCDYAAVTVNEIQDERKDTRVPTLEWRFEQIQIGARFFDCLEFETFILGHVAGVRFRRDPDADDLNGPLVRWPLGADPGQADIIPVAMNSADAPACLALMRSLAASDWHMLKALARVCQYILIQDNEQTGSASSQTRKIHGSGLGSLHKLLQQFPAALRFDGAALEREYLSDGYEHLSLKLDNLTFGKKGFGNFSFRLACANVDDNTFGTDPRLEFPYQEDPQVFDSWFEESCDELGPRLELRFALPDAIDLNVLARLSETDRKLLARLVNQLPSMLDMVQQQGTEISRPWEDWHGVAKEIDRILTLYADSAAAPAPENPFKEATP